MTPARVLLSKLDPIAGVGRSRISFDQAIQDLVSHLEWLKARHVRKQYSSRYLVDNCFLRSRTLGAKSEADAYCRVHLVVALDELRDLVLHLRGSAAKVPAAQAKAFRRTLSDYLFDLKPVVEYLEQQKDQSYVFFSGGKNRGVHTMELFRLSRTLANQSSFKPGFHMDHKTSQIVSVFVLRQALEAKFERLIGVNFQDSRGGTPKLRHGFHYDFIVSNPQHFDFKAVDFTLIRAVYDWCSEVVHKAYQPLVWQLAYADRICRGLFLSLQTPPNMGWSINNAVEIIDVGSMQQAFAQHFAKSYHHGFWSVYLVKPEAVAK